MSVYVIEAMTVDSMENDLSAAVRWSIIGYTEDCDVAGFFERQVWGAPFTTGWPLDTYYADAGPKAKYRVTPIKKIDDMVQIERRERFLHMLSEYLVGTSGKEWRQLREVLGFKPTNVAATEGLLDELLGGKP